ncbi:ATP-binding protein [Lactobacillus nasalidis]|nr:ATP-binding protein [Lactobacillus nasalidis]
MWACTFDSFVAAPNTREAFMKHKISRAADAFAAKNTAHNAVLYGQPGAGKSHLAMALMQKVHKESQQTMAFVNISRLFNKIKNSFEDPTEYWTKEKAIQIMTSVDLLCIDDLGTESSMGRQGQEASRWVQDVIYDVLENQDRIIITTNLSDKQLRQVYDSKIFSRIFANSANTRFDFSGISDKRLEGV